VSTLLCDICGGDHWTTDHPRDTPEATLLYVLGRLHVGARHPADLSWLSENGLHVAEKEKALTDRLWDALDKISDLTLGDRTGEEIVTAVGDIVRAALAPQEEP